MNLLELEVSGDPWASAEAVQDCVTRALAAPLEPHTKILFSQRGLQFAEDYSNSIQRSEFRRENKLDRSYKPFGSSVCVCVCPLQCAARLRGSPEAAEGARWNKERSRERVREGRITEY